MALVVAFLSSKTKSLHFFPIIMDGALVLPLAISGVIEASATRRPRMPFSVADFSKVGGVMTLLFLIVLVVAVCTRAAPKMKRTRPLVRAVANQTVTGCFIACGKMKGT